MKHLFAVLGACCVLAPAAVAGQSLASQSQSLMSGPAAQTRSTDMGERKLELLAAKLFDATLGRAPSSSELGQALEHLRDGRLQNLVSALVNSSEYRGHRGRMGARLTLQQFYRSLLGRSPDASGSASFEQELTRGRDAEVLTAIVASPEFQQRLAEEANAASPIEQACMEAVVQKVRAEQGAQIELDFSTIEIESTSFLYETLRGQAGVRGTSTRIEFSCRLQRLDGKVAEVRYQPLRGVQPTTRVERRVRCESDGGRQRRCPADTSGGVTLVRQLSHTACVEGQTWGYDDDGIWVDRGCRAEFLVSEEAAGDPGLMQSVSGWGYVRQRAGRGMWIDRGEVRLHGDGRAELHFAGDDSAHFSGRWFANGERKIELSIDGAMGDTSAAGAGGVWLEGKEIVEIRLAGKSSGPLGAFEVLFRAAEPVPNSSDTVWGNGELALTDGYRAPLRSAQVELSDNGSAQLRLAGDSAVLLAGRWYPGAGETVELVIDKINDSASRGGGTLYLRGGRVDRIEAAGVVDGTGKPFRIDFSRNSADER